jgi:hypothetical protein
MKTPEEIKKLIEEAIFLPLSRKEQDLALLEVIKQIQTEIYNEALDDATKISITSKTIYNAEINEDDWCPDSLWCNKHSILKLRK